MLRRICVVMLCYLASVVICLLHCVCSYDVLPGYPSVVICVILFYV
jgi:hypothetical protein